MCPSTYLKYIVNTIKNLQILFITVIDGFLTKLYSKCVASDYPYSKPHYSQVSQTNTHTTLIHQSTKAFFQAPHILWMI